MKTPLRHLLYSLFLAPLLFSCEPEFDSPPVESIPEGDKLTIEQLRDMYDGQPIRFEEDKSLYGVITMDERSGNIYKSAYMKDHTGAINLALQSSGGLYQGDSVRINLNGTTLNDYNGLIQIDSVDVDMNVVKQSTNNNVTPQNVTLDQLDSSYQSKLVKLQDVEFLPSHRDVNFADAEEQEPKNRTVIDCKGNSIIMRTSGFADFADQRTPEGHGSLIAIVSEFQSTLQLYIRRTSELDMEGLPCTILAKNFDDQSVTSGGWRLEDLQGPQTWETNDQGHSSYYVEISGYDGQDNANEDWLISPAFDASVADYELSFMNAMNFGTAQSTLELFVSTDYSGSGDPNNATWDPVNFNKSGGSWNWVQGGPVDLSAYNGPETYIAFKYTSTTNGSETWELDDIFLSEK